MLAPVLPQETPDAAPVLSQEAPDAGPKAAPGDP